MASQSPNKLSPPNGQSRRKSVTGRFVLGIDVGTTSVKVCLVNVDTGEVSHKFVKDTLATAAKDLPNADLQDAGKLFSALHGCISRIPHECLKKVERISICGQMHGIMFWKQGQAWSWNGSDEETAQVSRHQQWEVGPTSPVYTWQDARCSADFLSSLPVPDSHLRLSSGYGCATLFWLAKNKPEILTQYDRCGTIMDFIVSLFTNSDIVKTSDQLAASWGYFNTVKSQWNTDIIEPCGFPVKMLPEVLASEKDAGVLSHNWFDIPSGTPIGVALGDLQCSVRSTLIDSDTDAVLNVSTSAQMAFVKKPPFHPNDKPEDLTIEYFPYFGGTYVAVAASLNGGNCLAAFVKMLQEWAVDLGLTINQGKIWEKTIALGEKAKSEDDLMVIKPTLFGERHDPNLKGSVANLTSHNMGLGQVTRGICKGIAKNLAEMMSPEMLIEAGLTRIIGSGACLSRNPVLRAEVQEIYQMPVEFTNEGSACIGAALAAIDVHYQKKS